MAEFCKNANLPENVGTILLGEGYCELLKMPLKSHGIDVIPVPANPFVDKRVSSHADLSLFHAGGNVFYLAPYLKDTELANILTSFGVKCHFCDIIQGEKYPEDAGVNICSFGEYYVYNPNVGCKEIINELKGQGRRAVLCRQGYSKCSVAILDDKSIITADKGISSACRMAGIDVLEIQDGYIQLDGFDYGFIGGSTFKLDSHTLAFTGILDYHPDKGKILDFLSFKGISAVFLTDKPIFDIGSAIPAFEKNS